MSDESEIVVTWDGGVDVYKSPPYEFEVNSNVGDLIIIDENSDGIVRYNGFHWHKVELKVDAPE